MVRDGTTPLLSPLRCAASRGERRGEDMGQNGGRKGESEMKSTAGDKGYTWS